MKNLAAPLAAVFAGAKPDSEAKTPQKTTEFDGFDPVFGRVIAIFAEKTAIVRYNKIK